MAMALQHLWDRLLTSRRIGWIQIYTNNIFRWHMLIFWMSSWHGNAIRIVGPLQGNQPETSRVNLNGEACNCNMWIYKHFDPVTLKKEESVPLSIWGLVLWSNMPLLGYLRPSRETYICIYIWSRVNIWNVDCARETAFIFDRGTDVLVKLIQQAALRILAAKQRNIHM